MPLPVQTHPNAHIGRGSARDTTIRGVVRYFLRWRIFARIRRFRLPILRRPFPVLFVPMSKLTPRYFGCTAVIGFSASLPAEATETSDQRNRLQHFRLQRSATSFQRRLRSFSWLCRLVDLTGGRRSGQSDQRLQRQKEDQWSDPEVLQHSQQQQCCRVGNRGGFDEQG